MASGFPVGIISDQQSGKSFFATDLSSYGTFGKDSLGYIWTKGSSNSIYKISIDGVMSDKYTIASPEGYSLSIYTLKVDAGNNKVYVGGSLYSASFGTYKQRAFIAKLDISSGTPSMVWMQSIEAVESIKYSDNLYVNFDSGQNAYISFTEGVTNNDYANLTKFDSSGTKQWTMRISSGTLYNNVRSGNMAIDTSLNVFMVYHAYNTNTGEINSFVIKINSSGGVVAHKMLLQAWFGNLCHIMPNGDVLVGTYTDLHINNAWWLNTQAFVRINSSLTSIVSQAKLNVTNNEQYYPWLGTGQYQVYGDELYIGTWGNLTSSSPSTTSFWLKYLTNTGTVDLARSIKIDNSGTYASGTGFDISGESIMMTGYGPTIWFAKLPKDGGATGTFYSGAHKVEYNVVSNIIVDNPGYSLSSPTGVSVSTISPTNSSANLTAASAVAAGTPVNKIKRRKIKKKA